MDEKRRELCDIISRLSTGAYENNSVIFQGAYMLQLLKNWKPWPYAPDEFFQKCLFASCAQKVRTVSATVENEEKCYSEQGYRNTYGNVSGNPLDFDHNLSFQRNFSVSSNIKKKPACKPLTLGHARMICELYRRSWKGKDHSEVPLYVSCDGKDKNNTLLLGISRDKRLVTVGEGTICKRNEYPKLSVIKKCHLKDFHNTALKIETSVYMYYDIRQCISEEKSANILDLTTHELLVIECFGQELRSILQKPLIDCKCNMLIQAILGSDHSGASAKYKELKFAKALCTCVETGKMVWPEENQPNDVYERIADFYEKLGSGSQVRKGKKGCINIDPSNFDRLLASQVSEDHNDMDFTDHMWSVLSASSSSAELTEALKFMFEKVKDLPCAPYIYRNNFTTLATMVYNVAEHSTGMPSFKTTDAIKHLLEIGIEKLKKDYTFLFVGLGIVPYDVLLPFLEQLKDEFGKTLKCLQKLHTVLELVFICCCLLHLPIEELNAFARFLFKHYASVELVDPSHIFSYPVPLYPVKAMLEKLHPMIWQTKLQTSHKNFEKETLIQFSQKVDKCKSSNPEYLASKTIFISSDVFPKETDATKLEH